MTRATAKRKFAALLRAALREGQAAVRPTDPPTNHALLRRMEHLLKQEVKKVRYARWKAPHQTRGK